MKNYIALICFVTVSSVSIPLIAEGPKSGEINKLPLLAVGDKTSTALPKNYSLSQNYPNPFNPSTTIRYGLPARSMVNLEIYDVLGRIVATLVNGVQDARSHEVSWQARVPSGMYFYRIKAVPANDPAKSFVQVKKMLLLK